MSLVISDSEWRDFEKLIFRLLLDQYGIEESQINYLTQSKKDGGYDGIFYIPCTAGEYSIEESYLRVLFEAKLRSNVHHDLPLQEFSKALIISINKNADRLIIATNLYFSQRTIDTLFEYSQHTGLEIRFLTSYDIYQWLKNGGSESIKPLLESHELLDFLKDCYDKNHNRAKASSQQSIYNPQLDICPVKIIGDERKKAASEIAQVFHRESGVITVEGEAGIGKSVFTNQVLYDMGQSNNYNIQKIDIEYYRTPRLLFLKLLDHVWHIPFQILNTLDKNTVEDIVRWIGDRELPNEMRQTLISVFCKSTDDYHRFFDLFNYYLVEYTSQIYSAVKNRKPLLLSFTNINYADEDLLRFLLLLIKKFDKNICILLELRTSLYINEQVPDKVWMDFLGEIYQLPNLCRRIFISDWNPNEISQFIRDRMHPFQIPAHCVQAIRRRVGHNPLNLDTFLAYIHLNMENGSIPESYLEEYITNCPIENINHIIFLLINRLVHTMQYTAELLFMLGILGGHAPEKFLTGCIEQPIYGTLDQLLTKTPLLWRGQAEIYVSHSLYLAAIQNYNYISAFRKQELAQRLLEHLDELELDAFHRSSVQVELLQILKINDRAALCAFDLAQELFQDGQFHASYRYYVTAQICMEQMAVYPTELLARCMVGQICCKLQLENFTEEELTQELKDCREVLSHSLMPEESAREHFTAYLIAENQFLHYFGKFQESLAAVRNILSLLYRNKCSDVELIGAMWAEYAIAVKETSSLPDALDTFQKAVRICPESKNLRFAQLTHLSERFSSFDPEQAQIYLAQILDLEPFLNLTDRMHNRVNLATIKFYCGECGKALAEGTELMRETYLLSMRNEEGRLSNLLGCIALYSKDIEKAYRYFQHGVEIFHTKNYVAYLWPLFANLSTLYLQRGMHQEAFSMIQKCIGIFRDSYLLRIRQSPRIENTYEKLHIALLSMVGTLYELHLPESLVQQLLSEFYQIADGSVIINELRSIRSRQDAIELACGSAFCLNYEIYIKD